VRTDSMALLKEPWLQQTGSVAGAMVPSAMPSNPYALGPPGADPFGGTSTSNNMAMAAQPPQPGPNPWDMSPNSAAPAPWAPPPPSPARPPTMPAQIGMSSGASLQAPTPPPTLQPRPAAGGGGDFGDFFGGGHPTAPQQRAPTPLQQSSMVPAVPPNMQVQQQQHVEDGRPYLNQRDMSLSNVFGAPADAGGRPQMNTREASLSNVFGAPADVSARPQLNQKDASLSNIFGAPAPAPYTPSSAVPASGGGDAFGGVFDSAPTMAPADPWGAPMHSSEMSTALVVSSAVDDDPFGIFGAPTPVPAAAEPPKAAASAARPAGTFGESANPYSSNTDHQIVGATPAPREGGLPPGGEFYDAKIFTPTLGVISSSLKSC